MEGHAVELRQRLDQLAGVFAEGGIDAQQLATGTKRLHADLEDVRGGSAPSTPVARSPMWAAHPTPGAAWLDAPIDRRRAILDALVTVTVNQAPRGRPPDGRPASRTFDPKRCRSNGVHDEPSAPRRGAQSARPI